MKLRRECGRAASVRCRRASVAHQRANYFFSSARRGWGSERGRGLAGRGLSLLLRRKNVILILGSG